MKHVCVKFRALVGKRGRCVECDKPAPKRACRNFRGVNQDPFSAGPGGMVATDARWREFRQFFGKDVRKFRTYKEAEAHAKKKGWVNWSGDMPKFDQIKKERQAAEDRKLEGEILKDYRNKVMNLGEIG